jgi:1-acyl-sn-glycerol-3-phosphate acyltransferase
LKTLQAIGPFVILIRSALFNLIFYVVMLAYLCATLPAYLMPRRAMIAIARHWAKTNLFLLRIICGIRVDFQGLDKIPAGPLICASKHQSLWETFALLTLFDDPAYIMKRELMWIPLFGWATWKAGMIAVDRGARSAALAAMSARAKTEILRGRQLIIFPEGTRRPPGGEPKYKFGVAHLYSEIGVPCLPVALNSGLFWPRRSFMRYPGTVRVVLCDVIAPGLDRQAFFDRLEQEIETATAALIEDGRAGLRRAGVTPL